MTVRHLLDSVNLTVYPKDLHVLRQGRIVAVGSRLSKLSLFFVKDADL